MGNTDGVGIAKTALLKDAQYAEWSQLAIAQMVFGKAELALLADRKRGRKWRAVAPSCGAPFRYPGANGTSVKRHVVPLHRQDMLTNGVRTKANYCE